MIYVFDEIYNEDIEKLYQNIQRAIDLDETDIRQARIRDGVNYYNNKTAILNQTRVYYDADGNANTDTTRANNRITHSFYPLLVKQKVGYLLGKPINFASENQNITNYLGDILGAKWDLTAQELLKNASNKGDEWLYCYIDRDGIFSYTICPTEQIIPLYDNAFKTNLDGIIRYYTTENLRGEKINHIEFWTKDSVKYFEDGILIEEKAPFTVNGKGYSFGYVPFVQFKNNEDMTTDLSLIKDVIDAYDKVVSGLANDIEEIQDAIYVLKGYQGTDLTEFSNNLRFFKAIKVSEDGDLNKLEIHIPIEAKNSHVKRLEDDIYRLGMGVDVSAEKLGNSSGVALKFLYSLLDLKTDIAEAQFKRGIRHFLKIISAWYGVMYGAPFERKDVKVTFNRSLIVNTKEQIVNVANSVGMLSAKTLLSNHPFVSDVDFELTQMQEEGITPVWKSAQETEIDDSMTSGGYENTGEEPQEKI